MLGLGLSECGRRAVSLGSMSFAFEDGALSALSFADVEVVRGIQCLIRDPDWATLPHDEVSEEQDVRDGEAQESSQQMAHD